MEDYSLVKEIGNGSYGKVWLVKKNCNNKQYVLKQIDMQNASKQEQCSAYIEVKLLSSLKHPNIVSYYNSFQKPNGVLCIIMGYCENGDMYTYIRNRKGVLFPEKQIVEWFIQICMALQYLHERNILHRDLKTQNIFLTKTKIIKIGDLGIARVLDSTCDLATTLIGTPYYMSPELFANQPYNHKSDIWALGCCVYEMATLKHAFNARDLNSLMYKVLLRKLPAMPKQYSIELVDLMCLMLSYDASCRPTVKCVLQNDYIRRHIMDFLQETNSRYKTFSSKYEKCSAPVPNFPIHRNLESDVIKTKNAAVQSKRNSPVVNKEMDIPVAQETDKSLKSEYINITNPTSSETQHLDINEKFQEENVENCIKDKAQFFVERKENKSLDTSEHFFRNDPSKYFSSSEIRTIVENTQNNDRATATYNKNSLSHHSSVQDSKIEKVKITPPRRQRWKKAYSEGDTANTCDTSCNNCNNYKMNASVHPLPPIPSQLIVHSLEDVNTILCKGEHDNVHKSNFQQNKSVEQEKILPVAVLSQDSCIMSKNSEARRRRREKLQQQQLLIQNAEPTSKHHENSVNEGMISQSHAQLHYTLKKEIEHKEEKSDTEFQEFIGILDSTLQLKDEYNEKPHLTCKKVDKKCKNKLYETIAHENQVCLIQRRDMLIKDCSLVLGDKLLKEVLDAIDYTISNADLQSKLLYLLGKEHLDIYGGKIIQLKICEDAIAANYM